MRFFTILLLGLISLQPMAQTLEPTKKVEQIFKEYKTALIENNKIVWGFSLGATVDLGTSRNTAFRLFVSGAIARTLTDFRQLDEFDILATLQSEVEFFRGGLGTSVLNDERYKIHIEMRTSPQIVFGYDKGNRMFGRPMSISIGQSMSTLYDPFDVSLSLGTSFINGINHKRNQQVGYAMLGILPFQAYYANDGPPYGFFGLGDRFDRWWTGSGQAALFFLNDYLYVSDFGVRYDKFTGYQPNLYELAYTLQVDNLPYKEIEKQYFNQGRYQVRLGYRNMTHFTYSIYNPVRNDMQDRIHYNGGMPYHVKPMGSFKTYGVDFQYKNIKIVN